MRAPVPQYLHSSALSSSCFCLASWHLAIAIISHYVIYQKQTTYNATKTTLTNLKLD